MKQYIVDAFTEELFKGNPAAVCVMDAWLPDETMQKIAIENSLSETAFVVKEGESYRLRWFTPGCEVELCGHATLATSFVLANFYDKEAEEFVYQTLSGEIRVKRNGELFQLNLPAYKPEPIEPSEVMLQAVKCQPVEVYMTCDVMYILEDEKQVYDFEPDYAAIAAIQEGEGIIITAPSKEYDFVSRCFYPKEMINEDPVTGSAHCSLMPYWTKRLGKTEAIAYQASARGGKLYCEKKGDRIQVSGKAVLYSISEIYVPQGM